MTDQAQLEFWNGAPGQAWVELQPDLDALHAGVTELLIEAAELTPGERVLDVGCGAGALTFAAAHEVSPGGHVTGLDISEPLLREARALAERAELSNVDFMHGDAETRTFTPDGYHAVLSRFGMMFFEDTTAGLRNVLHALKKDGRIAFAAWAGIDENPWFDVPARAAEERLGPAGPAQADAPGPLRFADVKRVEKMLVEAGFQDVSGDAFKVDLHHPGGLDAVRRVAARIGPVARHLRDKGGTDADREAIVEDVVERFRRYETGDGVRIPAKITLFRGRRR